MSSSATPDEAKLLTSFSSGVSTPPSSAAGSSKSTNEAPSTTNNSMPNPSPPQQSSRASPIHPHQHYVDHSYTDYANVDEDDLRLMREGGDTKGAPSKLLLLGLGARDPSHRLTRARPAASESGNSVMPFPGKLLEVLDRGDLSAIIDWMPHGRAFIVKQPKIFAAQVLPRFFKQTKFLSFTRQLNLWGFKRITRGIDAGAYYHELFLPGRPNLAMRMKRQKIKGTGIRPIPNPAGEPNFYYNYPHVPRVPTLGVPLPLPPLPSERLANLMQGENPSSGVAASAVLGRTTQHPYGVMTHASYPGMIAPGMSMQGYPAVAAAALNGDRSLGPRKITPYANPEADLDLELASRLYMQQKANSLPTAASKTDGEISDANRRLMERLMDPASFSNSLPFHQSAASEAIRRLSAPSSAAAQTSDLSAVRRVSFKSQQSPPSTTAGSPMSSFYGAGGYMPLPTTGQGMSSLPTLPIGSKKEINLRTVTSAMRDAQHLEELARSKRASAEALARYMYNCE